ncbi:MAG: redoxin domain-containing protein [Candidatus Eisenbacteria bacterium]|nr:redoxin domain-containing protein [Candidatus Eisenbacteria bacterium]
MRGRIAGSASVLFLVLVVSAGAPAAVCAAEDGERVAFYMACAEPDPGARARAMIGFLEEYPDGPWSDRVRTLLFGVAASGGWRESENRPADGSLQRAVEREAAAFLAEDGNDPDRVLIVAEAYLRSGVRAEEALALARRGGALAEESERPADIPLRSWGRMKRERIARSHYLAGLAEVSRDDYDAAAESFRLAEDVFRSDPRFREEYARALVALGRVGMRPEDLLDERTAAMEAIGAEDATERIENFERYLLLHPDGPKATEIGIRLVEDYLGTPAPNRGVALATRIAGETEDPEVLSALCFLLAESGQGTAEAVRLGARAKETLREWIQDPGTEASVLPDLNAAYLMIRDGYGWALFRDGRTGEALEELRAAAESDFPRVLYHYGAALLEAGKAFDAVDPLVRARDGGEEEAGPLLDRIVERDSALREEVEHRTTRAEAVRKRDALAEPDPRPAPDFSLVSLDGETVALEDLRGGAAVIVFWTTWCEPCREMLPHLQAVADEYRDRNVRFLTIDTDRDFWLVRPYLRDEKIGITTLLTAGEPDWEETARAFRLSALPTVYWIDEEGRIRFVSDEYDGNGHAFRNTIRWRLDRLLSR